MDTSEFPRASNKASPDLCACAELIKDPALSLQSGEERGVLQQQPLGTDSGPCRPRVQIHVCRRLKSGTQNGGPLTRVTLFTPTSI
jgi:hypothetical protein